MHARGLLVGAEQWRGDGDLDDFNLAALGVWGVGQSLVSVQRPLVLHHTTPDELVVCKVYIHAPHGNDRKCPDSDTTIEQLEV